jgi:hypothetical protein
MRNLGFVAGGPLGVLLRDQALQPLRQLAVPVVPGVRPRLGQVKVTLMLERLGSGTVGDTVLQELVEVLGALQDHDHGGEAAGHPHGTVHRGHDRQTGGNRKSQGA